MRSRRRFILSGNVSLAARFRGLEKSNDVDDP